MRVAVKPALLRWACTRAGFAPDELTHRFPQLPAWVSGEVAPAAGRGLVYSIRISTQVRLPLSLQGLSAGLAYR